ncbi:hypothetical protein MGG_17076 [Pyricularia oryzae 70-15]|uniref:Uncharacterized protein n=1 Tax=Pyricularia oryzae (strain 70-15 / ATCC MYA-4617 / FGSC 8958) TaxID=242507 RepID=G4N7P6_PYRO7|nr:uncharacterized protein MGG_17076 [Pyricularia oryzae 70-15]EHA50051.1 hypothetical protein MGG_17076 [Pyricularia oryzae 70-15]
MTGAYCLHHTATLCQISAKYQTGAYFLSAAAFTASLPPPPPPPIQSLTLQPTARHDDGGDRESRQGERGRRGLGSAAGSRSGAARVWQGRAGRRDRGCVNLGLRGCNFSTFKCRGSWQEELDIKRQTRMLFI